MYCSTIFYHTRWIVVHGGVDGYSRIPVYLYASNNNKASTVLSLFLQAVSEYGLPSRVRSDKGGENVDVSAYMLSHIQRGPGRGSMITGKSYCLKGTVAFNCYFFYCHSVRSFS